MLPGQSADRWRTRHLAILQARARQANLWVLSADVIGHQEQHRSYGATAAIDPHGTIIDRVPEDRVGTVLAELSPRPNASRRF